MISNYFADGLSSMSVVPFNRKASNLGWNRRAT